MDTSEGATGIGKERDVVGADSESETGREAEGEGVSKEWEGGEGRVRAGAGSEGGLGWSGFGLGGRELSYWGGACWWVSSLRVLSLTT